MVKGTTRLRTPPHVAIQTLAVEVLDGPEAGSAVETESDTLTIGTARDNGLVLSDEAVSRYHLELTCTKRGVMVVDLGSTNGTRLGSTHIERATVPLGSVLELGRTKVRLGGGEGALVAIHGGTELKDLVGTSDAMRRIMAQIQRLAAKPVPTLLMGETGTGKEVVARAIQGLSARADEPFVTVDCGAFAPTLVASELFGHERGAFTGADRQHIGAFERANGGTIFLDEIGELPLELQPQLLGALERRRFRRLGGREDVSVDVQVLSATNRDLRNAVNEGHFRLDLYYRLAVVVLKIPPLRDRRSDIPLLVEHALRECGHGGAVEEVVPASVMTGLRKHSWPGNVRELKNWVEATLAMGEAGDLLTSAMPAGQSDDVQDALLDRPYKEARNRVIERFESRYLTRLIEGCDHNVSQAARKARMDRSYLIKLLQRHQLR